IRDATVTGVQTCALPILALELGRLQRAFGDVDRLLASNNRKRVDAHVAAEHRQLLLRSGPGDVERRHQHLLAVAFGEALGELGRSEERRVGKEWGSSGWQ